MDVKKILLNMAFLGIFVFGVMSFIVITQNENSVTIPITNDSLMNDTYGYLEANLSSTQSQAQSSDKAFFNSSIPTEPTGDLSITSIFSAGKTARAIIFGLWNIYVKLPQIILGVDPIVSKVISTILLIFIIIGIWAIWKGAIS